MTDTLLPILLTLPPISLDGVGIAPMVVGLAGSQPPSSGRTPRHGLFER